MNDSLMKWLSTQLDEDERVARANDPATTWSDSEGWAGTGLWLDVPPAMATHALRHDPARVLREVEAKRRTIGRIRYHADLLGWDEVHGDLLRLLVLPYVDRPGCRGEWLP